MFPLENSSLDIRYLHGHRIAGCVVRLLWQPVVVDVGVVAAGLREAGDGGGLVVRGPHGVVHLFSLDKDLELMVM